LARLNRSLANLKLGRFEDALVDASDQPKGSREKSLFRQARALYELRRYEECLSKMEEATRLYPDNVAFAPELKRARDRVMESKTGNFPFAQMYKQASKPIPLITCATFSTPVEVRDSPGRGRGLFATRNVKAGEMLLCEKAFAYRFADPESTNPTDSTHFLMQVGSKVAYMGSQTQLIVDIVQKLQHNPVSSRAFLDLHPGDYEPVMVDEVDGRPVVDTWVAQTNYPR
jgi:hypothetical protein